MFQLFRPGQRPYASSTVPRRVRARRANDAYRAPDVRSPANIMNRKHVIAALLFLLLAGTAQATSAPRTVGLSMAVDATDLPRRLLSSTILMDVTSPVTVVRYPEWIPGTHAPTRQLSNLAGFEVTDLAGKPLHWARDSVERHHFRVDVPPGVRRIRIALRYICNQPTENSDGVDCYGNPTMGIVNWNAITVYPAGVPAASVMASVSVTLPPGWAHGTAMRTRSKKGDTITFEPADYQTLLDRPMLCGQYLRTVTLAAKNAPPHRLHLMSDIDTNLRLEDDLKQKLTAMVEETGAYLGGYPYDSYDLLVVLTNSFPRIGLEHTDSSLSCTDEESLLEEKTRKRDFDYLVSHEFAHAWCGKYRRPRAMIVPDFNTPEQTELLWVYEGMTQYLSWIIPIRCGLQDQDEFLQLLAFGIERMMSQRGRTWRPLEDTAAASYLLRGRSDSWGNLRRNQDYYQEGALMWQEIDTLIRQETLGEKSLADFTKSFFARKKALEPKSGTRVVGFDLDEIVRELDRVHHKDWAAFLRLRTRETQAELPTDFLQKAGYRMVYESNRSELLKDLERSWGKRGWTNLVSSLGFSAGDDGRVWGVVPGGPGDKAHLFDGAKLVAVDGRAFSLKRVNDSVERSLSTRGIDLIVQEGDLFRNVRIDYAGGPRFLKLERDETYPDGIEKLLAPLREGAPKKEPDKEKDKGKSKPEK